jgi:Mn-dependent DtxR family transcriptional regulator
MQQRQIDVSGSQYVPLSQRQISDITGVAYKTVNNIIKELKDNGYIMYQGTTRGKYSLTDKARTELAKMQSKGAKQ